MCPGNLMPSYYLMLRLVDWGMKRNVNLGVLGNIDVCFEENQEYLMMPMSCMLVSDMMESTPKIGWTVTYHKLLAVATIDPVPVGLSISIT